ncbi:uncharacterized protein M437DRAFT_80884 [Aureobasidium melanogenum CBS 110374]|uniref:Uncharacterized protein n=1 Tax=Aureobasidium melanogenum (strain CBS 110374) TaxID=1043003 RepID=A0A074W0Q4_AURM1|nr:uncharacterized protein M437DRAFT_80884 [Aureobasidium melanogenum CBS 110374]KEQ66393.1 hypothetical protein M437DRAFT_80884 [Aureobasidium melanogenum CBS 110374]
MSGRGSAAAPSSRPVTPMDQTLVTRPVPRRCGFVTRSFGPGAASDIRSRVCSIRDLLDSADETTYTPARRGKFTMSYSPSGDDVRHLLKECAEWELASFRSDERMPPPDPTWGFTVFVTAYDELSRKQLQQAMQNWLRVQERELANGYTLPAFATEAWKRFKLDIIEDQEALDEASDDRVRAGFRALVRSKELSDDEDQFLPPARNLACLVLDAAAITMLAQLKFPEELEDDREAFKDKRVTAIDIQWNRPQTSTSTYRGTGQLSINALARFYYLVTSGPDLQCMQDMHPLDVVP